MSDDSTTQCLLFPGIFRKPIVAQFDQREGSSDGGALLLKAADRHYDLVAGLSSCLRDERQAGKVDHSLRELVAQRVFSIACGYPDANDSARLSGDPIHKLLLDRYPTERRDLASQPTLPRLVRMIRHHLPGVQIRVRLDGGFAHPAVLEFLDAQPKLEYVVAMAKNAVLKRVAESGMRRARQLSRRSGKTEHIYGEARYKAGKWPGYRRVIIKAEVVRAADKDPKDNPRFVITNMKQSPQWIYEHIYCQRGDIENRIKELHDLEIDRTSCTSFWANQFRVLLTAAAYVLMQELRLRAAGTACARAQVCMLRERLLKLGARVLVSVRRVVVHLPASFPFLPAFRRVALALGAATG